MPAGAVVDPRGAEIVDAGLACAMAAPEEVAVQTPEIREPMPRWLDLTTQSPQAGLAWVVEESELDLLINPDWDLDGLIDAGEALADLPP